MKNSYPWLPKRNKTYWLAVYLGLVCTALLGLVPFFKIPLLSSFIRDADFKMYDQMIALNWHTHTRSPRVIIINIDDESIHKEGRWPWRRDKMAELLNTLKEDGVVTIGLDIVMSEEEVNYALGLKEKLEQINKTPSAATKKLYKTLAAVAPEVDSDKALAETLLNHNVILGFLFHNDTAVRKGKLPPPLTDAKGNLLSPNELNAVDFRSYNGSVAVLVNAASKSGFVTNIPDEDGTNRRALLLAQNDAKLYPSMALATAMNYLLVENVTLVKSSNKLRGISLDGTFIPTNSEGQILIPFWGGPGTLEYYSATDILQHKVPLKNLQGTIAIIGSTITLLADLHESPLSLSFPGVEIVGNIVQGIVSQQLIAAYDWHSVSGGLLALGTGVVLALLFPLLSINYVLLMSLFLDILILAGTIWFYIKQQLYFPSALLIALVTLQAIVYYAYSFILERQQKKHISHLFGQYVPKDYLSELIDHPENFSMEGQTRNMTVLFADIRNFTSLSENLDATSVKRLLNTFFTPITEIIFKNRGTIDKYVGDMIVAFWGAPIEDEDHASHAITSALSIFANLDAINATMIQNNLPAVHIGLGLATGLMNVGDMGSEFRRAYTVLGDTVNLASRLQDLTKFYKVDILVNDITRAKQDTILWRTVDKVTVKGRKTALSISEPVGLVSQASPQTIQEIADYHLALEKYYAQEWAAASSLLQQISIQNPHCYLYQLYLERIKTFTTSPPPQDWDGVYTHLQK